jgi:hypothetical protein
VEGVQHPPYYSDFVLLGAVTEVLTTRTTALTSCNVSRETLHNFSEKSAKNPEIGFTNPRKSGIMVEYYE